MITKPDISIFASAHRPQNWMALYRSIGINDIEFEVVFVGPNPPDYELPKNFRFIKSLVKPPQCAEIAARNTRAELIMDIADDYEFTTSHPLDRLYALYRSFNSDKLIVSPRVMTDGQDQSHFAHYFLSGDDTTPVMPVCGLMSKKVYHNLGGIDKNFIAVMWSLDIAMRVYALGGKVVLSDVYINEDRSKRAGSNLCGEFWGHDRGLVESLWMSNGKVSLIRKKPVESFTGVNILRASQGPRGRWRGREFWLIEKIKDGIVKGGVILNRMIRGIRKPSQYLNYAKRILLKLMGKS